MGVCRRTRALLRLSCGISALAFGDYHRAELGDILRSQLRSRFFSLWRRLLGFSGKLKG